MNERLTIRQLTTLYQSGDYSPVEHTRKLFERIHEQNDDLGAYLYLTEQEALAAAHNAERLYAQGIMISPLQGVTVGVKDVIYTQDAPTTLQTELYTRQLVNRPGYDATAVKRLRESGAVILGKTNTHEMGMGPTGDVGYGPHAVNPYDSNKVSGGSSSGSAVAVAAGLCDVALGTDTGGSVRLPSALCGVVGMKPTFGLVSNYGMAPLAYSCDAIGPMTYSVADNAAVLQVIAGYDPQDMYSVDRSIDSFNSLIQADARSLRVGVPYAWLEEKLDPQLRTSVYQLIDQLRDQVGCQIVDLSAAGLLPTRAELAELRAAHQLVLISEAYQAHQPELLHPGTFAQVIYDRLQTGRTQTIDYVTAYQQKNTLQQLYKRVYQTVDVVLTPSVMAPACDLYAEELVIEGEANTTMKAYTEFTWIDSFTGYPSLAVPTSRTTEGLPLGVLLNAAPHQEARLYQLGAVIERLFHALDGAMPNLAGR